MIQTIESLKRIIENIDENPLAISNWEASIYKKCYEILTKDIDINSKIKELEELKYNEIKQQFYFRYSYIIDNIILLLERGLKK